MIGAYRIPLEDIYIAKSLGMSITTGVLWVESANRYVRTIETLDGQPIFLYIRDEPNLHGYSPEEVKALGDRLKSATGIRTFCTIWCGDSGEDYEKYRDSVDVIGVDIYPWHGCWLTYYLWSRWREGTRFLDIASKALAGREWVGIPQSGSTLTEKGVAIPPKSVWADWVQKFLNAGASHILSYDWTGVKSQL